MAFMELNFRSHALNMTVSVNVILPERGSAEETGGCPEGTYKTLYLLHGLGGNHSDWARKTAIERYASQHGIAVVMPGVCRSWYSDTVYGAKYFTFITEELPQVCRSYFNGMTDRREDNLIGGLSMGGYGALKAAMTYPDRYCGVISLSGALDITRKNRPCNLPEWQSIFDYNMVSPDELEGSCHDLFYLTRKAAESGSKMPDIFLWCGTEDGLITINREYRDMLTELNIPLTYTESQGNHNWLYWDMHIQPGLQALLG